MTDKIPCGIRNNNPGNIRKGDTWKGMSADQTDKAFCRFETPAYGIRAMCMILLKYQLKYGLSTIREIITRWAPPSENPTAAYIIAVSRRTGINVNQVIDLKNVMYLKPLIDAMIFQENGQQPYDNQTLHEGMSMAYADYSFKK